MRQQGKNCPQGSHGAGWTAGQVHDQAGPRDDADTPAQGSKGRLLGPLCRISSARPGTFRSHTARVASGVLSRAERPVPPVVSTSCALRAADRSTSVSCARSSVEIVAARTSHPDSRSMPTTAGPERSSCKAAAQRSLAVITMAVRPSNDGADILPQNS